MKGCLYSFWLAAAVFAILVMVTGCASYDTAQSAVAGQGARAADEARQTAEWTLCNAITVGAWRRAYAADPQRAAAWVVLCGGPQGAPQ